MSQFSALNTALSGLHTYQKVSEIAGKNIANVNTEGYSRNRADLTEATLPSGARVFSRSTNAGDGVGVSQVARLRDELLERRNITELAHGANLDETAAGLSRVEGVINEPSDSGLAAQLNDFWNSWDDLANNPGNLGARAQVVAQGQTVAATLHGSAMSLTALRDETVSSLGSFVTEVNSNLDQIAKLNSVLRALGSNSGGALNDSADQRDLLVEKVAQMTGATSFKDDSGNINININGVSVVWGDLATHIDPPVAQLGPPPPPATTWAPISLTVNNGINAVNLTEGRLGGMLTTVNQTVPSFLSGLDAVANKLVADVNAVHSTGFGLNDPGPASPGRNFFDPAGVTALSIGVDAAVVGTPADVAAAAAPGSLDGSIAQMLATLHNAAGGASTLYQSVVSQLAVQSQSAQRMASTQANVVAQVDAERKSVSGVNIDDELISITSAQQAYAANARVVTIVDQMLDTLINMARH